MEPNFGQSEEGDSRKPAVASTSNDAERSIGVHPKQMDETKTNGIKMDEVKMDEVKTNGIKMTDEAKTDEVKTDEVKTDEVKTDEVKTDKVKTDKVKTNERQAAEQLSVTKRLEQLRSSVAALEKILDPGIVEDDDKSPAVEESPGRGDRPQRKSTPTLNYMKIEEYQKRDEKLVKHKDSRMSLLQDTHSSIDVVLAAGTSIPPRTATDALSREETFGDTVSAVKTHKSTITCAEQIRFIQINSQALCSLLHEVIYSSDTSISDPPEAPIVMLAPFKPLCHHMGKLEERLKSLEQQYAGMGWEQMPGASELGCSGAGQPSTDNDKQTQSDAAESTPHKLKPDRPSPPDTSRVPVTYNGDLGWLQLTEDGLHIVFTGRRQGYIWSFADKLENIISVRRTTKTSPVIALKIMLDDVMETTDEFVFTDKENAQAQLDMLSDALAIHINYGRATRIVTSRRNSAQGLTADHITAAEAFKASIPETSTAHNQDDNVRHVRTRMYFEVLEHALWEPIVSQSETVIDANDALGTGDRDATGTKAMEDLRCLTSFYESLVKPWWDPLKAKKIAAVRFADLCSLIRPGDSVYVPDEDQKFWRVVKVTGGRPTLDHLLSTSFTAGIDSVGEANVETAKRPKSTAKEGQSTTKDGATSAEQEPQTKAASEYRKWTVFVIDCYYIDFDGRKYAPVHRKFQTNYFTGSKSVNALKAYPIDWCKPDQATPSSLSYNAEKNGRRFEELCVTEKMIREKNGTRLYYYDGRTNVRSPSGKNLPREPNYWWESEEKLLPASRLVRSEDVNSHVVIDFDKTFQYNPDWSPCFNETDFATRDTYERSSRETDWRDNIEQMCEWESSLDQEAFNEWLEDDRWMRPQDEDTTSGNIQLTQSDYCLLPDRAFGFILRTRTWACLDIRTERLRVISPKETDLDQLQIPEVHKTALTSLVERHFDNKNASQESNNSVDFDFVQGKGKGLIVLLHGAPGLGKTSTAEVIASKYCKPLLPITCGNLGTTASSVEQALTENFELAQAWDCIVLLDEADVFLAQRDQNDLERNALVSVFLRTLEYYTGILFLTTNRVGSFDEAFRSRIHSALFYKNLGVEETKRIWRTNIERLTDQKRRMKQAFEVETEGDILSYAEIVFQVYKRCDKAPWNGREIRNAFQTAVALAEHQAKRNSPPTTPTLTWEHFRTVLLASQDFELYLLETRGETDEEFAGRKKLRHDHNRSAADAMNVAKQNAKQLKQARELKHYLDKLAPHMILPPEDPAQYDRPLADRPQSGYRQAEQLRTPARGSPGPQNSGRYGGANESGSYGSGHGSRSFGAQAQSRDRSDAYGRSDIADMGHDMYTPDGRTPPVRAGASREDDYDHNEQDFNEADSVWPSQHSQNAYAESSARVQSSRGGPMQRGGRPAGAQTPTPGDKPPWAT
ncbi:hypothetical protein LTR56_018196 [Elasticomyces elasticus]|nr:hypothetical protein LTR56_018196 [Elasticomyces elasticus]KAK3665673.1 hypothetical protein LTR22_003614 [Elasticomyces elasticus]KAK5749976.1 hypothetical protein LTS12_019986 [Elasticomyces elasticus]